MKKFGFTLAEVLITLGIIGVVAALTTPALIQNTGTAKVGPTLAKVVSTLELANESILKDEEATRLSSVAENTDEYMELLSRYISGGSYNNEELAASDFNPTPTTWTGSALFPEMGLNYNEFKEFHFADSITLLIAASAQDLGFYRSKGSFTGAYGVLLVDINGIKSKPNAAGKDIFFFNVDRSGQIIPMGSNTEAWLYNNDNNKYSSENSSRSCNENNVTTGFGCAGSIFENNLKVIYQ